MEESARLVPMNVNAKLLIRHSIRPTLQGVTKHEYVGLTAEGVTLARTFGEKIGYNIGELHCSTIPRCIETLKCIMTNRTEKRDIIFSHEVLTDVFATNRTLANLSFKKIGSLKQIVYLLQGNNCLPGFRRVDECATIILDYMFKTGNMTGVLDIYCTHDFQLSLLDSVLFSQYASYEEVKAEWPNMLEGMFFWGDRNNFQCAWRGSVKSFNNFLIM